MAATTSEMVPHAWPGAVIAILASGPSLTQEDVDSCRGRARVIAIKDAIDLAPWADVLYACGSDAGRWWHHFGPKHTDFQGLRYTLDPNAKQWATVLKNCGETGLELDRSGLRHGHNSGYQAINLAVHLGAATIVLLGYDMQLGPGGRRHFYGQHPWQSQPTFATFTRYFPTLLRPLAELGIKVINATPNSALTCFPLRPLEEALEDAVAA